MFAALVFFYLLMDLGLAWMYVDRLINPGCPDPGPISRFPVAQEVLLAPEDGLALKAWYYPSQNGAVILAAGGSGGSLGDQLPPTGFLREAGYGVLQIEGRNCVGKPVTLGGDETLDVLAAAGWLQHQSQEDAIGAFGFSMGGVSVIRAAAREPAIRAIVAEGGFHNLGDDFVEQGTRKGFFESILLYTIAWVFNLRTDIDPWHISPVDEIGEISPRPVMLVYGDKEAESGRAERQYAAAGVPKYLWIVPGGDHGVNQQVAKDAYERRILDFFEKELVESVK